MATVNIGNLTFTHRGDYDGSTAYSKNDVVYYSTNGNAYIAKQATTGNVPTNATYWSQFAQGSGGIWNAGLSLGTAGQLVKVNSGASALEFGDAPSSIVASSYASSSIANGYEKNANGIIYQWGSWALGSNSSGSITFPLTFPNYIYVLLISLQNSVENNNSNLENAGNPTTSGFSWHQGNNGQNARRGYYLAIGK